MTSYDEYRAVGFSEAQAALLARDSAGPRRPARECSTRCARFSPQVTYEGPEGALIAGDGKSVMFQQVSGYNPPRWRDPTHPQQAHLDIQVDDLDAGEARAQELGASRLNGGGERFRVFADPAGHPFCLTV